MIIFTFFFLKFLFEKKFASYLRPKTRKSKRSKTVPSDLRLSPSISSNSSPIGLNQNQIESSPIKRQKLNICLVKKSYDPDHYQIKASERVEDDQPEYDETIMQSEENKAIVSYLSNDNQLNPLNCSSISSNQAPCEHFDPSNLDHLKKLRDNFLRMPRKF